MWILARRSKTCSNANYMIKSHVDLTCPITFGEIENTLRVFIITSEVLLIIEDTYAQNKEKRSDNGKYQDIYKTHQHGTAPAGDSHMYFA